MSFLNCRSVIFYRFSKGYKKMYNKKVFGRRMNDKGLLQWASHSGEENNAHEGHSFKVQGL